MADVFNYFKNIIHSLLRSRDFFRRRYFLGGIFKQIQATVSLYSERSNRRMGNISPLPKPQASSLSRLSHSSIERTV